MPSREAQTAAALDHPNIIPIHRVSSGGRLFWYAMKFLEGHALDEMLKEKGFTQILFGRHGTIATICATN